MTEVLGFATMPRFNLRTLLTALTAFCVVLSVSLFFVGDLEGEGIRVRLPIAAGGLVAVGITLAFNRHQPPNSEQSILLEGIFLSIMCLMISVVTVPMAMLMFGD